LRGWSRAGTTPRGTSSLWRAAASSTLCKCTATACTSYHHTHVHDDRVAEALSADCCLSLAPAAHACSDEVEELRERYPDLTVFRSREVLGESTMEPH
jgi:hypothetical protein